jgi:hypothetical protein
MSSYEEQNWLLISPTRRDVHNKLREARGLAPLSLPPPDLDRYVPPKATTTSEARPFDFKDREFVASARQFLGPPLLDGGEVGFTINGQKAKF